MGENRTFLIFALRKITGLKAEIEFKESALSREVLRDLYRAMLEPRMIEEKMLKRLRQGKISKWFSGIGQEAIAAGSTLAINSDDLIFTMHRNLGVFTAREVPLERLFCQWQGKLPGFTKGRDRSFHFGAPEYGIIGMISHLGPQLSLACGTALASNLKNLKRIAVSYTGEGGTSQGEFHEALNVASVWNLPVIFLIENNGYGLSTPVSEQYNCESLADKGKGYGMEAYTIDGNNILEVFNTVHRLATELRERPRPVLLECMTFRMRGHEEASGTKYVPNELMESWAKKDPLSNFERYLLAEGILNHDEIGAMQEDIQRKIDVALEFADGQPDIEVSYENEAGDVYRPAEITHVAPGQEATEMRLVDAIRDGHLEGMKRHPELILMGQDIAGYGGVFKVTEGLADMFGKDRVRNTPLCESAIIGTALGLSMEGMKSMVEMQFADFVSCGFNQIVNNLAKLHYRWEGRADVVIRMPTGAGVAAGPFHSQSNEAWFFHTPGLKIAYPSNSYDAKGLLLTAFADPNPVMYFEHKALYRNHSSTVPSGYYTIPFGKANLVSEGTRASIITYGMGVHWAREVMERMGLSLDILDLRTLAPIDYAAIEESVAKTNKVLILHEDTLVGGIGGELAAYINEHCFRDLDAPVIRVASMDTPVPFNPRLEKQFLASNRLEEKLHYLINY